MADLHNMMVRVIDEDANEEHVCPLSEALLYEEDRDEVIPDLVELGYAYVGGGAAALFRLERVEG